MALPPPRAAANALGELFALPYDFTAVMEWRPLDKTAALSRIRAVQKHYNTQRWSFWAAMTETEGTNVALDDAPSGAAVDQLYRAALELDTHGVPYGELSFSVAVGGWDQSEVDQVGGLVQRVFTQADGKAVKERFGQTAIWFGRYPGQKAQPLPRPILVSSGTAAALAPLFGGARGYDRCDHLDKPALTQFETRWGTPYGYDLFGGADVGHTLVLGATGSGKSFLPQLPAAAVAAVQAAGDDSRSWRLVPLDHEAARWRVPVDAARAGRRRRGRAARLAAVLAAAGGADLRVPGELGCSGCWPSGSTSARPADIDDIRKRIADTYPVLGPTSGPWGRWCGSSRRG